MCHTYPLQFSPFIFLQERRQVEIKQKATVTIHYFPFYQPPKHFYTFSVFFVLVAKPSHLSLFTHSPCDLLLTRLPRLVALLCGCRRAFRLPGAFPRTISLYSTLFPTLNASPFTPLMPGPTIYSSVIILLGVKAGTKSEWKKIKQTSIKTKTKK